MCDPDSAGLSAELHDITTWDFANFSCHLYLACSKWTLYILWYYSTMIDFLKDHHLRWAHPWGAEQVPKPLKHL